MASAAYYNQLLQSSPNLRRFLNLIGWAEGANYNTGFGGRTFSSYAWHPYSARSFRDPRDGSPTSAAGKYQYIRSTWDNIARRLGLRDFSPHSQDIGAVGLIDQRGALQDVLNGNVVSAVNKLKPEWESFKDKPLNSILNKWRGDGRVIPLGRQFPNSAPTSAPNVIPDSSPVFDSSVSVIGARNRYLIAFAILVIIFVFAFN